MLMYCHSSLCHFCQSNEYVCGTLRPLVEVYQSTQTYTLENVQIISAFLNPMEDLSDTI